MIFDQKKYFEPKYSIQQTFSLSPSELGTAQSQLVLAFCWWVVVVETDFSVKLKSQSEQKKQFHK